MGTQGADVMLSEAAHGVFPYGVECKNQQIYKGLYKTYDQAVSHGDDSEPLVIIKMNNKTPLALVDAEHFLGMVEELWTLKKTT